jgi:signal transduction histidine kinase
MESVPQVRNMSSMTGLRGAEQPSAGPAVPTLAALRAARASRIATLQRRGMPIGAAMVAILAISVARSDPKPGLHGTPLVITLAACCFLASLTALIWLLGGVLSRMPIRPVMPRAQPLAMVLLVASSATLTWLQSQGPGIIGLYLTVAVAARTYSRRLGAAMFSLCLTFFLALVVAGDAVWHGTRHGLPGLTDVVAIIPVYLMSLFARRIREQEDQEEQLLAELEESRAAELRAAALSERQRLAREMHDVLAHSLSGLVVQLEGARVLAVTAPGDPRLPEAVDRAHQLAKSGLDEARQAIGMLRDDDLPGPDRLSGLAAAFTADTGIPCQFTQAGESRELSSAVRLALYRVTQEALTNVRKHARPDEVDVRLEYLKSTVALTVEDIARQPVRTGAGPSRADPAGGYGLTGMRERAGLLGGTLDAGPTGAGFRVRLLAPA